VRSDLTSIVEFTSTNIPHLLPLLNELIICAEEESTMSYDLVFGNMQRDWSCGRTPPRPILSGRDQAR